MSLSRITALVCGCPATWDANLGEYVGECQCPPEKQRARWLAEEHARMVRADESRKRSEAPLHVKPFRLMR